MRKFSVGDRVKHKGSDHHVFEVLQELESVPPGGPSLYRCMTLPDESRLFNYLESDLYRVELNDEEIQATTMKRRFEPPRSRNRRIGFARP